MFTVGIFTTHFPYIAFVVFYAFFFLFGVKVPVEENIQVNNSKFNIELQTSKSFADTNADSNFHYQTDTDFSTQTNFEESLFKRKLNNQFTLITVHWQYCLYNSLFSRPPPSLTWFHWFSGNSYCKKCTGFYTVFYFYHRPVLIFPVFYSFEKSFLW